MKKLILMGWEQIKGLNLPFEKIYFIIGFLALFSLLSSLSSILHSTVAPKAVIYAKDNDAGRGIQTATISPWYKSNHFAPYGNLNYRVAHTLAVITPTNLAGTWSEIEKTEITNHYALLITNLICLATFCFFLSFIVTAQCDQSLILTPIILNLAILNPAWVEFIFRAHPDHMLMLLVGLSSYWTMKYSKSRTQKDFIIAGLMWGLATAVKRSTILFIPSFLFLFLSDGFNKRNILLGLQFIGWMLLSYLVIGFPQNFGFYKHINFLIHESSNSLRADWTSVKRYALDTFDQFKYIVLALIPTHLLFGKQERVWSWKFIIFTLIALGVYLSRQMTSYAHHHPMAYAALMIIAIYSLIKSLPVLEFKFKKPIFFTFCLASLSFYPTNWTTYREGYVAQMNCRFEILRILADIKKRQMDPSMRLLREPYFPFDSKKNMTSQSWGITFNDIENTNAKLIGIKKGFGDLYLAEPPSHFNKSKRIGWTDKQRFYQSIQGKSKFVTESGNTFERTYNDQCGYELWEKI